MGFFPTMTHLFEKHKLNKRFDWFSKPDTFCKKYKEHLDLNRYYHGEKPTTFVHKLGPLNNLSAKSFELHHFWYNIVNRNVETHLECMKNEKTFPYLPFIIKPKIKIHIDKKILDKLPNCEGYKLLTEIRLFPQSITTIHLKAYIKGSFRVRDLVFLQRKFRNDRLLVINKQSKRKLGLDPDWTYSANEFFVDVRNKILKTLYIGEIGDVDKTSQLTTCSFMNPLGEIELSEKEIASLLTLSRNPKRNEIRNAIKNKLTGEKKVKDPSDIIAYQDFKSLLYVPANMGRETKCLRNNFINSIELAFIQWLFVKRIICQFDKHHIWHSEKKKDFLFNPKKSALIPIINGFKKHRESLHGIHQRIFMSVSDKSKQELLGEKILMSYKFDGIAKEVKSQLEEPQEYLETIVVNSFDENFEGDIFDAGIAKKLQKKGRQIISEIQASYAVLEDEEGKINSDQNKIQDALIDTQSSINEYKMNYLPRYKNLVKGLVAKKEEVKQKVEEKRKEGKKVPEKNTVEKLFEFAKEKLDEANKVESDVQKENADEKPKSFFEKAKPYLGAIASGAGAILKALGYLPA